MNSPLPFEFPFVRFAEVVNWPRNIVWGPRRIYDHELVYVISGELYLTLEDRIVIAPADHLVFIAPRVLHTFRTPKEAHTHLGIHFDWIMREDSTSYFWPVAEPPVQEQLFRELCQIPQWDVDASPLLDLRARPAVRQMLYSVTEARAQSGEYSRLKAGALLAAAIAQISHEAGLHLDAVVDQHVGPDAVRRVFRAREWLEEPCETALSICEVAALLGWSTDHLGKMCRKVLGVSPHRIQLQARLRRARHMLHYGSERIDEIAHCCGFKNASHFMTTFKRETGLTPRQFAQLQGNHRVATNLRLREEREAEGR